MQKSNLPKRILADAILVCAVFLLPWWLALIFGAVFAFYFEQYYELLLAGLAIDSLYNLPAHFPLYSTHFQFAVSFACAVLFLIIIPLRQRLRFY